MNWLSSIFSSGSSSSRKGQAIHSTHDAFSIPTHSPVFGPTHPDAFNPDSLNTPDTATYSYPPSSPVTYGYMPTRSGSRPASLLPTHRDSLHTPMHSPTSYPPLATTWNRLRMWLNREYPELGDTLNYGILPQDFAQIEMQFGFALPNVVRESYLVVDGQEAESSAGCSEGLFFGLTLLPLEDVLEEWRFWREVDEDPSTGANPQLREAMQSIPPGWVRREYSQRGWIPLIADKAGNYIGVDLNPGESGASGQVIIFGRDFDTKVVLFNGDGAAGWAKWLAAFVEDLETGEGFEIGNPEDSEGSEDDVGYESYFHDGTGRGQGDGGGDSSSAGGLRLVGEYKGWNVLEAWADRSVRKWYEAGVISESIEGEKKTHQEKVSITSLDLNQDSAAEVAIPVLAEVGDEPADSIVTPVATTAPARKSPQNLPTISVTKPPVPLPVELPTPRDIVALPSPPDSTHSSFDEDRESSGIRGRRERPRDIEEGLFTANANASASSSSASGSKTATPAMSNRMSPPPDLMEEDSEVLETTPIIQPSSLSSPVSPHIPSSSPNQESLIDADTPAEPEAEVGNTTVTEADPDVTIRLVGGGGSSGLVTEEPEEEQEAPEFELGTETDGDAASIASSVASEVKAEEKKHKHKKSKSLASLKKFVGKKKDSVSSVKDKEATVKEESKQ
ncbi:Cell wall assembly regulator [Stygiomarasmius scandens]|uniref:Cell wall assembly regulator n=1 Tax=Marasmiellus scandens TaxID=2682957 RepID=A0ABR1J916_9AGAR